MRNVFVTRELAEIILMLDGNHLSVGDLTAIAEVFNEFREVRMLSTGAKLYFVPESGASKYMIGGYAMDGSDVMNLISKVDKAFDYVHGNITWEEYNG